METIHWKRNLVELDDNASGYTTTHTKDTYNTDTASHILLLSFAASSLLHRRVLRAEVQADTIDAVALVGRGGEPLALEDVAQVAAAVGAYDLDALHEHAGVLEALDGAGDAVEVGRPAAAALELVRRLVQGRVAPGARVHARGRGVLVELAGPGGLGALLAEDPELL